MSEIPSPTCNATLRIRLGSLNCRTILKVTRPDQTDMLIQHLKYEKLDILACQETNTPTHSFQLTVNTLDM